MTMGYDPEDPRGQTVRRNIESGYYTQPKGTPAREPRRRAMPNRCGTIIRGAK